MLQKRERMYHIKSDKRSGKSAKLICEGLAAMLNKKSYCDITISDVCACCGIARTTFYRLFDTMDDVLLYQFDGLFEAGIAQYRSGSDPARSYAYIILNIALSDRALVTALIAGGRTDLFDFSSRLKENQMLQDIGLTLADSERQYCTAMLNAILISAIKVWIKNGGMESVDELYESLKMNVSVILKYL